MINAFNVPHPGPGLYVILHYMQLITKTTKDND